MSHYFSEIREQPQTLLYTYESIQADLKELSPIIQKLQQGGIQRILFTGMGASYYAVYPSLIYLTQHGIQAQVVETSELLYYYSQLIDEKTLVVLLSQSGHSVEILRLLDILPDRILTLGITNTPDSPLAKQADIVFFLQAGKEETVSTKTNTSTLLALRLLSTVLAQQSLVDFDHETNHLSEQIDTFLPTWDEQTSILVEQLRGRQFLSFLARGASMASAMTGALITKESAKTPTEGMNCAQFRHGPMEIADERIASFVFIGDSQTRKTNMNFAHELASLGVYTTIIDKLNLGDANHIQLMKIPEVTPWMHPIVEIIPIQFVAGKLAEQNGYSAGSFRYIGKVTTIE